MVTALLVLVVGLLALIAFVVVGSLVVVGQSLAAIAARLEQPGLSPGDTVYVNALGQLRECIVAAVDANGTPIVRPIGPNLAATADD